MNTFKTAQANACAFELMDGWGGVAATFACPPEQIDIHLLDAFIWGFPLHHRRALAEQLMACPDAEAKSGEWRLKRVRA